MGSLITEYISCLYYCKRCLSRSKSLVAVLVTCIEVMAVDMAYFIYSITNVLYIHR